MLYEDPVNGDLEGRVPPGPDTRLVQLRRGRVRLVATMNGRDLVGGVYGGACDYDYALHRVLSDVILVEPLPPPPGTAFASAPPAPEAPPHVTLSAARVVLSPEAEAHRGDLLLRRGDIVAARHLYQRAASGGDGHAAAALGWTYDPAFKARSRGAALADPLVARVWYQRAQLLGDHERDLRLRALEAPEAEGGS